MVKFQPFYYKWVNHKINKLQVLTQLVRNCIKKVFGGVASVETIIKILKSYRYRYSIDFSSHKERLWFIPKTIINKKSQTMVFNSYRVALEKNSTIKVNALHKS